VLKTYSGFETKVLVAFTIAVLVVAGITATTWKVAYDASEAARWVAHSHEVLDSLAKTKSDTLLIEYATQSFRISGDPARLVDRDAAIADRENLLGRVKQLVSENTAQLERWAQLREVVNERMAISRRVEFLRKTQGQEAASAFVVSAPLQETRQRTYRWLGEMDAAERRSLESRSAEQLQAQHSLLTTGALVALSLFALLTATYALISRQLRDTEASRRALADSEENLSTTLHSIGDAVMATDLRGRITRMNPVAERLTGWPVAEARGRPVDEVFCIISEQTRMPAVVPVAKVLETGAVQELANHTALLARNGSECPIADSAAPICDSTGHMHGVVLVFRDVTVERQAQQAIKDANQLLEQRVQERTSQLHTTEEHLRSVISNVPALIAYVDVEQRYVYVNDQYRQRFAPERSDIAGCTVHEILGDERYAIAAPLIVRALQGEPQSYDWQPFADVWQSIDYIPKRDAEQRVAGYYVLGRDITARKRSEETIQTLNADLARQVRNLEQVSRALKTLSAGNRTMLRAEDEQQLLASMCRAIVDEGGYPTAVVWYREDDEGQSLKPMAQRGYPGGQLALEKLTVSWADNEHGQGVGATAIRTGHSSVIRDMFTDPNYAAWQPYLRNNACAVASPLRVGSEVIGALAIYGVEQDSISAEEVALLAESADDLAFGIATLRARAERQKIQETLHRMTHCDLLTGLPNETRFTELLAAAIDAGHRLQQPFAVLQTNIERLSEINDALGFNYGDQMLREFCSRLCAVAPAPAVVARLRGDEFAILLPESDSGAAFALMQRLDGVLTQPFLLADIYLEMSVNAGVVVFPEHGSTAHDLFRHMDIALQLAKKKGVGCVVFDPLQDRNPSHRLNLAGELRRAIEGGDLSLYLQPKVEMATGRVCGAEGLVRWRHAERGLIFPGEFIELAEHTGLIKPLTEWVIETALRLNHGWMQQDCALPIAVNLSARNLHDEGLLEKIRQLQATWGVPNGLLELEITESTVMEDAEFALRVLHGLRAQGIPLYIDDFGTGYSSLSYLLKLPVEYIKIDQTFVRGMLVSKDSSVIVRSTIELAHDLGRMVVAEGVETRENWDQLAALGCDFAQGYFIGRPMPSADFPLWLQQFRAPLPPPETPNLEDM